MGFQPVIPSGSGAVALLFNTTLAAPAATITIPAAGNLPTGYTHLEVIGIFRTSAAVVFDNLYLEFNADSGTNYESQELLGNNSSTAANPLGPSVAPSSTKIGYCPGSSADANYFGHIDILVPTYLGTTALKTARAISGALNTTASTTNWATKLVTERYNSQNAITSMLIGSENGGNFVVGTQVSVYGKQ